MKRLTVFISVLVIWLCVFPINVDALEAFVIDKMNINVDVALDNKYDVTEKLNVTFSQQRHGIFRTIPSKYNGKRILVKNIKVDEWPFTVATTSDTVTIQIGDPDKLVNGPQVYTIHYNYDMGYAGNAQYDEFYYNLVGNGWNTYINNVTFNVTMPKEFDKSKLNITSGTWGSTDNTRVSYTVTGNKISGQTKQKLNPNEAVTIALNLPKGYYVATIFDIIMDNILYIFAALLIIISFLIWFFKGRDRKLFPTVEFYPPDGITPGEVGYVFDGSVETKDVTSLIIYWANKGYLTIEEQKVEGVLSDKDVMILTKVKDIDSDSKPFEIKMYNELFNVFGDGTKVTTEDLKYKFADSLQFIKLNIKQYFEKDKKIKIFLKETRVLSGIIQFFSIILMAIFINNTFGDIFSTDNSMNKIIFIIITSLFASAPNFYVVNQAIKWKKKARNEKVVSAVSSLLIYGVLIVIAVALTYSFNDNGSKIPGLIIVFISGFIISLFAGMTTKRTEYGNSLLERLIGFKNFINEAEKEKLEALVLQNPAYFYNILPYAYVLGVTDIWSNKFDQIALEPPDWYAGQYFNTGFNTMLFANYLDNSFNDFGHTMSQSPPSSGSNFGGGISSSSGGSSGGGSGGGGGGSW